MKVGVWGWGYGVRVKIGVLEGENNQFGIPFVKLVFSYFHRVVIFFIFKELTFPKENIFQKF